MKAREMRRSMGALLLCLYVFTGAWAGMAAAADGQARSQTPEQAVAELRRALDTADVALLDSVADVDAVIGQAVDVFMEDARTPEGQAGLPPMLAMVLSSVDSSPQARSMARSLLQREAGEFVRYGVRSGNFAGNPRAAAPPSGLLAPAFADASLGRKEIRGIGPAVTTDAGTVVPFTVRDHGNGNDYPVQAVLTRVGGQWRITALHNARELMDRVRRESVE